MKISEVLSVENLNKEFICESNGCRVKNVEDDSISWVIVVGKSEENWEPSYLPCIDRSIMKELKKMKITKVIRY